MLGSTRPFCIRYYACIRQMCISTGPRSYEDRLKQRLPRLNRVYRPGLHESTNNLRLDEIHLSALGIM